MSRTAALIMDEAAKALHRSRRWLQEWLRAHPTDGYGVPFYSPLGRAKLFTDADISRILETVREQERCRLSSSHRQRPAGRHTSPSAAPSSESTLTEALRLANGGRPPRSCASGKSRSNVVRFDPLCAHHQKPNKQGLFALSQNRYSATRAGTNRETRTPTRGLSVDFAHGSFSPRPRSQEGLR